MGMYGKDYETEHEKQYRFTLFIANLLYMASFVQKYNLTDDQLFNVFSDRSEEELEQMHGLIFSPTDIKTSQILLLNQTNLPREVNWLDKGYVTSVKH